MTTPDLQEITLFNPEKLASRLSELPIELSASTPPHYHETDPYYPHLSFIAQLKRLNPLDRFPEPPVSIERFDKKIYSEAITKRALEAGQTKIQLCTRTTFSDVNTPGYLNAAWRYIRSSEVALSFPLTDRDGLGTIRVVDANWARFSVGEDSIETLEEKLSNPTSSSSGSVEVVYPDKDFEEFDEFGIHLAKDSTDGSIKRSKKLRDLNLVRALAITASILEKVDPSQLKLLQQ